MDHQKSKRMCCSFFAVVDESKLEKRLKTDEPFLSKRFYGGVVEYVDNSYPNIGPIGAETDL